ncbi:hypothetical protein ACFS7Z_20320 [Pontibacter toksunensis]|uniref:Uncharacterized protein n=1 Tax=Pontibacter toksunensis TaxID=1332631 RepID=A0ABW6C0B5_9BACT
MKLTESEGEFEDLCQQYTTWIHAYVSDRFETPLYHIWLTDSTDENDRTDKFILSKDNKIITSTSPIGLLHAVKDLEIPFPDDTKTKEWLIRTFLSDPAPSVVYDMKFLEAAILKKEMTHDFIKEAINFINLFGDLGHQLEDEDLLDLTWDNAARDLWDFYYDNIFWPRWGHEDTFDESKVPKFEPDYEELKENFDVLIKEFESRFDIR